MCVSDNIYKAMLPDRVSIINLENNIFELRLTLLQARIYRFDFAF